MSLRNVIQSVNNWQSMTDGELHSILNEIRINPDPTPYTFASLGEELTRRGYPGSDIRSQVAYTMLQIELKEKILPVEYEKVRGDIKAAYIAMSATKEGLSLHTTERQQLIGLLAQVGNWQPGVMEAVLSLGVSQTKLFECTLEQVSTEKAAILLYNLKRSKQQAAANRYNIYIDAIEAWDGSGEEPVL